MIRYGEYLKKSDIDSLTESGFSDGEYAKLVKVGDNDPGILGGYEVTTSTILKVISTIHTQYMKLSF